MVSIVARLRELTLDQFASSDVKRDEALDLFKQLERYLKDQQSNGFIAKKEVDDLATFYAVRIKQLQGTKGILKDYKKTAIDIYKNFIKNLERLGK